MRRWIAAIGLFVLAFAAGGAAHVGLAQDPATPTATPRTLEVVGRGTVQLAPDTAVITVGVSSTGDTPSSAYQATAKAMTLVAAALKGLGVEAEDIKTQELNLNAEYNWTQDKGQELKGYRASSSLRISTQKLDQVGTLVEAAVGAGANQLHSIQFTVKHPEKLLEQATDLAVDNAMDKANRVSRRMGTAVVSVLRVTVMDDGGSVMSSAPMMAEGKMAASVPVFGGTSQYTVTISATFEIK